MPNKNLVIEQTKRWVSSVVIEHSICPFAKREYDNDRIHYEVIESKQLAEQLEQLVLQCEAMDNNKQLETALIIFPHSLTDFEDYLDLVDLATQLLEKQAYEGMYQLASFHPQYRFADSSIDDPSNYTNRSPYPMLHILREASLEKALEYYENPEDIPERNIQLSQKLGLKVMKKLLKDCY